MGKQVYPQSKQVMAAFQSVFANEEMLFQVVELFPIPIQVFSPDGTVVYTNQAVLEMWNIADRDQLMGKYNLLKDPFVNERLGLGKYIQRIFHGEIVWIPDVKVPLRFFSELYEPRNPDYDIESMYTDILNFPITDQNEDITHIVSIFITTRMYIGKSNIALAQEYIENQWLQEFSLNRVAEAVNLSRYHFARLFKKHTGMTPFSYYQDIKIRKLKEALCDTNLTVTQAFASCGVEYCGSYAKLFKEKTGLTPTQYRKTVTQ